MLDRKKRVLLLGASGYLGTQLMAVLRQDPELETIGTCCTSSAKKDLVRLDVTEPEPFLKLLEKFFPDEIIWVMMSGQKEQQLIESGLGVLLQWMTERTRLLFVSTDGIFAQGTGGFTEEDEGMPLPKVNPLFGYVEAKRMGESWIRSRHHNHLILRVGPIYGKNSEGIWDKRVSSMLEQCREGKEIHVPGNLFKSFLHVEDLAAALHELVKSSHKGTLHLGRNQKESYYSFYLKMAMEHGLLPDFIKENEISAEEACSRGVPLDTSLDTSRAEEILTTSFRRVADLV